MLFWFRVFLRLFHSVKYILLCRILFACNNIFMKQPEHRKKRTVKQNYIFLSFDEIFYGHDFSSDFNLLSTILFWLKISAIVVYSIYFYTRLSHLRSFFDGITRFFKGQRPNSKNPGRSFHNKMFVIVSFTKLNA